MSTIYAVEVTERERATLLALLSDLCDPDSADGEAVGRAAGRLWAVAAVLDRMTPVGAQGADAT